jgi:hypothetical protein
VVSGFGNSVEYLTLNLHFIYSDRAWFTVSGYRNRQNDRYWSTENRHEVQLHDFKM